jgi:predicted nucleic acid-binding protein
MTHDNVGVLLDCDYIIALTVQTEQTHAAAKTLFHRMSAHKQYILNTTLYELATVYSRKFGHVQALEVLSSIKKSGIVLLDIAEIEEDAWNIFQSERKKSTSFFDCAVLATAQHFGLAIASFDKFYPKALRIESWNT